MRTNVVRTIGEVARRLQGRVDKNGGTNSKSHMLQPTNHSGHMVVSVNVEFQYVCPAHY